MTRDKKTPAGNGNAVPDSDAAAPDAVGKSSETTESAAKSGAVEEADASVAGEAAESSDVQTLRADIEALRERSMRLQADFDNFRKRTQREKSDLYKQANLDLILDLLPVLDHFDLALNASGTGRVAEPDPVVEGVKLVYSQMMAVLRKFGLSPMETADQEFDPSRHEAVSVQESDQVPENHVISQTRRGYLLGDRLIRPAQVIVSHGRPVGATASAEPAPAKE